MPRYQPPVKVALVGTTCCGKTTVFSGCRRALSNREDGVFIEETAREFFERNPNAPHFSYQTQARIQQLTLTREQRAVDANPTFILCDRSVIDAVIYTAAAGDDNGSRRLCEAVRPWLSTYTRFALLEPAGVPYEPDDIRTESASQRLALHGLFRKWLLTLRLPHDVIGGTEAERIERTMALLGSDRPSTPGPLV